MNRATWMSTPALLIAALLASGCDEGGMVVGGDQPPAAEARPLDLAEAAGRWRLRVAHRSRTSATLRNAANTVVLYADPLGEVYVNGRALEDSGGIEATGTSFRIPAGLVARVCPLLRPVAPPVVSGPPGGAAPARPAPAPRCTIGRVVIDPGHGGKDPGATSTAGYYEKDLVLSVSDRLASALEARGTETRLTRADDRFIELEARPAVANRWGAEAFVSIHADAARNGSARGFTVYVSRSASGSCLALAEAIARRLRAAGVPSRGVRRADYRVLVHSNVPAVLVELGFLSNRYEAARLGQDGYQNRLASAIAAGVVDFLRAK